MHSSSNAFCAVVHASNNCLPIPTFQSNMSFVAVISRGGVSSVDGWAVTHPLLKTVPAYFNRSQVQLRPLRRLGCRSFYCRDCHFLLPPVPAERKYRPQHDPVMVGQQRVHRHCRLQGHSTQDPRRRRDVWVCVYYLRCSRRY